MAAFAVFVVPSFAISDAEYRKLYEESDDLRNANEELNEAWDEAKEMLPEEVLRNSKQSKPSG